MNTIHNPMTIHMNNQALIILNTFIRLARLTHDNRNTLTLSIVLCVSFGNSFQTQGPSRNSFVLCLWWNQPSQKARERKHTQ